MNKPEPIRVGVQGFVAFEAKPDAHQSIDWDRLDGLPAFGMYLAENRLEVQRTPEFYACYCQWHADKGYWPNETPFGTLKDPR